MATDAPSTPVARQISLRTVIQALLDEGPISRAQIAKITGLSKQTISEVVRELEDDGWLRERGRTQGVLGRSAVTYEINNRAAFVLGMDLGGTKLRMAVADLAGAVLAEEEVPTDLRGGLHVVEQIAALARRLAARAGVPAAGLRFGVMGTPGVVDPESGAIHVAPNIPGVDRIDVAGALRERLGITIAIENDVNLAVKGEQWQGHGAGAGTFAFIALGTGIGMGIVADGKLLRGARGAAGEIAYLPIGGDPYDPRGFMLGTLETAVGSKGIADRYRDYGGTAGTTVREIFTALEAGDAIAAVTIDETARLIAPALIAVQALIDPEVIVLGGSIGVRTELFERIRHHLARCGHVPPRLAISRIGNRAALIGAIGAALTDLHNSLFGLDVKPGDLSLPTVGGADGDP
ncbi:ROK family transcriptional regulator [Chelatococcus asaccharovorans]|uniref:Putative NBD/HSP70 family sugar kinase n=1 Tax=Chelatococcus asaccharovorans TaxID=28210 RepID=A0A2V3U0B4_9HYPH|nr:ROK family transcriptional regulator [Chelatococcus asaccharovorans]MBS7704783.1 ROK family transcriptional regulator [Chelatococcus asaccharovorans]PXW54681.1 putative NBD/HSP70 family sugar kinase [Chelatococcus asaccharovorans]